MSRQRYIGVPAPAAAFAAFAPMRRRLCDLRLKCAPFGADYLALAALIQQMDATAAHFTGEADFYGGRAPEHRTPASGVHD